jgi:hypothetical protein
MEGQTLFEVHCSNKGERVLSPAEKAALLKENDLWFHFIFDDPSNKRIEVRPNGMDGVEPLITVYYMGEDDPILGRLENQLYHPFTSNQWVVFSVGCHFFSSPSALTYTAEDLEYILVNLDLFEENFLDFLGSGELVTGHARFSVRFCVN